MRLLDLGFLKALGLLFIGLRLTNHIDWAWWWVLAPLWVYVVWEILKILAVDSAIKDIKKANENSPPK